MPTFNLTLGQTVRVYGLLEIEADTMLEAIEKIRADYPDGVWDNVTDVDYSTVNEPTIVCLSADDNVLLEGLALYEPANSQEDILTQNELTLMLIDMIVEQWPTELLPKAVAT